MTQRLQQAKSNCNRLLSFFRYFPTKFSPSRRRRNTAVLRGGSHQTDGLRCDRHVIAVVRNVKIPVSQVRRHRTVQESVSRAGKVGLSLSGQTRFEGNIAQGANRGWWQRGEPYLLRVVFQNAEEIPPLNPGSLQVKLPCYPVLPRLHMGRAGGSALDPNVSHVSESFRKRTAEQPTSCRRFLPPKKCLPTGTPRHGTRVFHDCLSFRDKRPSSPLRLP